MTDDLYSTHRQRLNEGQEWPEQEPVAIVGDSCPQCRLLKAENTALRELLEAAKAAQQRLLNEIDTMMRGQ